MDMIIATVVTTHAVYVQHVLLHSPRSSDPKFIAAQLSALVDALMKTSYTCVYEAL